MYTSRTSFKVCKRKRHLCKVKPSLALADYHAIVRGHAGGGSSRSAAMGGHSVLPPLDAPPPVPHTHTGPLVSVHVDGCVSADKNRDPTLCRLVLTWCSDMCVHAVQNCLSKKTLKLRKSKIPEHDRSNQDSEPHRPGAGRTRCYAGARTAHVLVATART